MRKSIHAQCFDRERDENGNLTGALCRRSDEHDREGNRLDRRMHYDPDREHFWGLDLDGSLRATQQKILDHLNATVDVPGRLQELLREAGHDPGV